MSDEHVGTFLRPLSSCSCSRCCGRAAEAAPRHCCCQADRRRHMLSMSTRTGEPKHGGCNGVWKRCRSRAKAETRQCHYSLQHLHLLNMFVRHNPNPGGDFCRELLQHCNCARITSKTGLMRLNKTVAKGFHFITATLLLLQSTHRHHQNIDVKTLSCRRRRRRLRRS